MLVGEIAEDAGNLGANLSVPPRRHVHLDDLPAHQLRVPPVVRPAGIFLSRQWLYCGRHRRPLMIATILDPRPAGQAQPLPTAPPAGTITPMTEREFATDVVRKLRAAGHTALWAGGCVRDMLLD